MNGLAIVHRRMERQWFFAACFLAGLATVLLAFQEWPGLSASSMGLLSDAGYAQCLSNGWHAGMAGCFTNMGQPVGGVRASGLPVPALAAALFGWDGGITFGEVQFVSALFTTIAFCGAALLFRRLTASNWIALLGALLYLLAPIVSQQGSYGALRTGYALLPLYLLVDSALFGIGDKRWRMRVAIVVAVVALRIFAVLCDGYSFVMSSSLALCFYCVSGLVLRRVGTAAIAVALYLAACALAYASYFVFVPGGESGLGVMPIDFFRGQGVDLFTVFVPSPLFWFYHSLGVAFDFPAAAAFGDGSNVGFNFAGYALLFSTGVVLAQRALGRLKLGPLLASLALGGLIAFCLSLGPSLKYRSFDSGLAGGTAHFSTYLMPEDKALASLATDDIYLHVPGLRNIRALARWQGVVHFALVGFIVVLVSRLVERKRNVLAGVLALAALVESSPNLAAGFQDGQGSRLFGPEISARSRRAGADWIKDRYLPELRRLTHPQERALLVQLHQGAEGNHYLADYLCPEADLRCYNVGGDKALEIVRDSWPQEVEGLLAGRNIEFNIRQLFLARRVDVVLVTLFDLRRPEGSNDALHVDPAEVRQRVGAITAGGDFTREDGNYFISLRPAPKLLQGPACGPDCWRAWPLVPKDGRIVDWGPKAEAKGQGFNRQANGRSALWVRVANDPDRYVISFGGALLPTFSGNGAVSALLPTRVEKALLASRSYNVEVIDVLESKRIALGDFQVDAPPTQH